MTCLICDYGMDGDTGPGEEDNAGVLRIQITEVGGLEPNLQLPEGGIDAEMCGDCWRWIRGIAADPQALLAEGAQPSATIEHDAESDD